MRGGMGTVKVEVRRRTRKDLLHHRLLAGDRAVVAYRRVRVLREAHAILAKRGARPGNVQGRALPVVTHAKPSL